MDNYFKTAQNPDFKRRFSGSDQDRFSPQARNPFYKSTRLSQTPEGNIHLMEWQVMDHYPVEADEKRTSNLYVTDWQIMD